MDNFEVRDQYGRKSEPEQLGQVKKETYSGDFVSDNQQMSGEQDFGNVSKAWLDKCTTYDDALEVLHDGARYSSDVVTKAKAWEAVCEPETPYNDKHVFRMKNWDTGMTYTPTRYATRQLASWLHLSTGTVKDALDPVYSDRDKTQVLWPVSEESIRGFTTTVNARLPKLQEPGGGDRELMFRMWTDDNTIRSVHSKKYARIDSRWFVEKLKDMIPGGMLSHWRGDRDNIYGNILIPDTIREEDDSDYGGMMSVGNSEIGMRRLSATPSVFRSICMNGCIWDQEVGHTLQVRHIGDIDLRDLEVRLRDNLQAQIPLMDSNITRMLSTRERGVEGVDMKNIFAAVSKEFSTTKSENTGILKAYSVENEILAGNANNAFGITQAMTRYGQDLDNEGWVRFDELGGRMVTLTDSKWSAIVSRARTYTTADVEKQLGLPALAVSV